MRLAAWSVLVYAILIALGGILGYVRAHSLPSLYASIPSAIALLACTPGLFRSKRPALIVALVVVLLLDAFFTFRFSQSQVWMPAGMMMLVSLVTLSTIVYSARQHPINS